MTIKFRCPHAQCKRSLVVKDHLAGKKANCPACKKPIQIPVPKKPVNVEAEAAAAFAEGPPPVADDKPKAISLECPFCAETVTFALELAGKQAPCPNPECRRIVKVPVPKEHKPDDWRQQKVALPSGAKQHVERVLEAQKAANMATGRVSREALEEAGALPIVVEPEPVGERVRRWAGRLVLVAALAGGVALIWTWFTREQQKGKEQEALKDALAWLQEKTFVFAAPAELRPKVTTEMLAELHRAAGDFYSRNPRRERADIELARKHLLTAVSLLQTTKQTADTDLLLRDVALLQLNLGGPPEDAQEGKCLAWDEVRKDLSRTLRAARTEGQLFALRDVCTRLLELKESGVAGSLAQELDDSGAGGVSVLRSQPVAIALALKQTNVAAKQLPLPKDNKLDLTTRLAYAEGMARQGNFEEARKVAQVEGLPLERVYASLGVAAIALGSKRSAEASTNLDDALKVLQGEMRGARVPPLVYWLAARLAAQTGTGDAQALVNRIEGDSGAKARAQLEIFAKQLADGGNPNLEQFKATKTAGYAQALELLAEAKARRGQTTDLPDVETLGEEFRPFLSIGMALAERPPR
jgi:hypothetical protein